jgi:hypothetical protein
MTTPVRVIELRQVTGRSAMSDDVDDPAARMALMTEVVLGVFAMANIDATVDRSVLTIIRRHTRGHQS